MNNWFGYLRPANIPTQVLESRYRSFEQRTSPSDLPCTWPSSRCDSIKLWSTTEGIEASVLSFLLLSDGQGRKVPGNLCDISLPWCESLINSLVDLASLDEIRTMFQEYIQASFSSASFMKWLTSLYRWGWTPTSPLSLLWNPSRWLFVRTTRSITFQ